MKVITLSTTSFRRNNMFRGEMQSQRTHNHRPHKKTLRLERKTICFPQQKQNKIKESKAYLNHTQNTQNKVSSCCVSHSIFHIPANHQRYKYETIAILVHILSYMSRPTHSSQASHTSRAFSYASPTSPNLFDL